jgi:tetratricopeptide (TPR) repeat protein
MRGRLIVGGAVAACAAAASLLGGALAGERSSTPPAAVPRAEIAADRSLSGAGLGDTASVVARLQHELRARPDDAEKLALLGLAYQQRARETGDPSYYPKSEGVLRRALALAPDDLVATGGLASLALSRHRFREALALGRRALRISPTTARTYGVVGDALVELGRYDAAFRAFDRMSSLKPSLASYARIAYARELLGRPRAALAAMRLALDAALGQAEPLAWTHWQLGRLHWSIGETAAARREYREALAALPGYVYGLDALAHAEVARGRVERAIALERQAVDRIPLPQFVGALGDLLHLAGRERQARRQYATVRVIERVLRANGVRTDLESALFDVDHGLGLRQTLALARRARAERPSIDGDDVLAWALTRNGRCAEALEYSRHALRLGTKDALKYFHRGMVERCLDHRVAARAWFERALALNPHFSTLWSPLARRYVR